MRKNTFDSCDKHITKEINLAIPEHTFRHSGVVRCNPSALLCSSCGSTERKLGAGKAPGDASLLCECGKFIRWVSGSELQAIASQLNQEVL